MTSTKLVIFPLGCSGLVCYLGDSISIETNNLVHAFSEYLKIKHENIPIYPKHNLIDFIKGSHFEKIPPHIKSQILSEPHSIGTFNRMGMYLSSKNASLEPFDSNILSEGTTFGTIQVLPSGQPIILLADSQTTGGYATLGTVIYSDLWKLVQMQQGNTVQLIPIDLDEARLLNKRLQLFLNYLKIECRNRER